MSVASLQSSPVVVSTVVPNLTRSIEGREMIFPDARLIRNEVLLVLEQFKLIDGVNEDVRAACGAVTDLVMDAEERVFADKNSFDEWLTAQRLRLVDEAQQPEGTEVQLEGGDNHMVVALLASIKTVVDDLLKIVDEVDVQEGEADHFAKFGHIGNDLLFKGPFGLKRFVYADWTASGRMSADVEDHLRDNVYPFMANTHTETSEGGRKMTELYEDARKVVKGHIGANDNDILLFTGQGMTGAVDKFQEILDIKKEPVSKGLMAMQNSLPEDRRALIEELLPVLIDQEQKQRPVIFVTRLEHHSNDITWREADCDVVHVPNGEDGLPDLAALQRLCDEYGERPLIGAFTACSNVTGVVTPYHKMAKIMHQNGGKCFVDFAASAPYTKIDMHPEDDEEALDAVYFSPHKFLGGPGSSGVLAFNKILYRRSVPTVPGGGTVKWTAPKAQSYIGSETVKQIEAREDGGTPAILQGIRAGEAIKLKDRMGVDKMRTREEYLVNKAMDRLGAIDGLNIFHGENRERYGIISFEVEGLHYNLLAALLNDRFGIQMRGGCSCAGTLGHDLFAMDEGKSQEVTSKIENGDMSCKPGWLRLSLHPTMSNLEVEFILRAIEQAVQMSNVWRRDYKFDESTGGWHKGE